VTESDALPVFDVPPDVDELAAALRPIMTKGLPVRPDVDDPRLLGLRGVVARSIDPRDRLSRVKGLDELLRKLLVYYPSDSRGEIARVLFGLAPGTRGTTLTKRRERVHEETGYSVHHLKTEIEAEVRRTLAWELHRDSQNYTPRSTGVPPSPAISGDTPAITVGDVSARDVSEHEEALSRLWSAVYELRADILLVERLKGWSHDETEPDTSATVEADAVAQRDRSVQQVKVLVQAYLDRHGERIAHGEAEYSVSGLLRLSGWLAH